MGYGERICCALASLKVASQTFRVVFAAADRNLDSSVQFSDGRASRDSQRQ